MPTTNTRYLTPRDLEAVYDDLVPKAIEVFNTDGELRPVVLIVTMADEEGVIENIDWLPDQLSVALQRSGSAKDVMMAIVASLLAEDSPVRKACLSGGMPRPDVIVHMTEAWCLINHCEPTQGSIAEHPDRGEAVLFSMHTSLGTTMQMLPVDPSSRTVEFTAF